ncbi:MAG TPA: flagellar hook-length control protein FliK, partial [Campylobacter avium]|nr:flagellar hook-length control protein FliK [Campylobacter avium]
MINTQVRNSINVSSNKTDLKDVVGKQNQSDNTKDTLALALKKNLGLIQQGTNPSQLPLNDTQELNLKLKSLINKFLDQLHSQGSTSDKFIKQGSALNFAPNFSNELKFLASEMQKSDIFKDVLVKLEQILKPASETKTSNLAMLFKNSGVFFEAKLKDALSPELLPKSFHSLVNAIKSVSSDKIANEIIALANKELDPKSSLSELKNIIQNEQNINKEVIKNSSFKALLELGSKLENFKKYISKNPSLAQEKIQNLASKILTDLNKLEPKLKAEINKLENLALKDTSFLKNLNQSFLSLKENLKNILNPTPQNKNPSNNNTPQTNTVNIKTQEKEHTNPFFSKNT